MCEPLEEMSASLTWPSLAHVTICESPVNGINFVFEDSRNLFSDLILILNVNVENYLKNVALMTRVKRKNQTIFRPIP